MPLFWSASICANAIFFCANACSSANCSSSILPNSAFAAIRSSNVKLISSLICLCNSASFWYVNCNCLWFASANFTSFLNATNALAYSLASVTVFFNSFAVAFKFLEKLDCSTAVIPVAIWVNPTAASARPSFIKSKSLVNTPFITVPNAPKVSISPCILSTKFCLIEVHKSAIACCGSSKVLVILWPTFTAKSITFWNTAFIVSPAIATESITTWFCIIISFNWIKAPTISPIPIALNAKATALTPSFILIKLDLESTAAWLVPFTPCCRSFISSIAFSASTFIFIIFSCDILSKYYSNYLLKHSSKTCVIFF